MGERVAICPECGAPPWTDHPCGKRFADDSKKAPTGDALLAHFKVCDCHDSWDQCPCADDGHPKDGSCDCCEFGVGLCGPLVARAAALRPSEGSE